MTDPQAAWVAKRKTRPIFAYDANYLIDNKLGVIVDAEARAPIARTNMTPPRP